MLTVMDDPWWKSAVIYQVYPRSFADGNGDGVGDQEGLLAHLDHIAWLGADAIWLSPVNRSPMADMGYDVQDYCDIDPLFGSLDDLDRVVAACHESGLRLLFDLVPNHTSDQHPWFVASRSSRNDPKRDWYVWRDPKPDGSPPTNWLSTFTKGAPAWNLVEATGQYYLHQFLPQQPDLNWENRDVRAAIHDVMRFWLDRGIDGFRIDAIHCLGRDLAVDDPPEMVDKGLPHSAVNDSNRTHAYVRQLRGVVDGYDGERVLLGEVFLRATTAIAKYLRPGELHLAFDIPFSFAPWDAGALRHCVQTVLDELGPIGATPTWTLSNHDRPRHRTRFGGGEDRARAAAILLLTLPGTSVLYQGEELGLEDATIPEPEWRDPGGRDGCRAAIPWTTAADHGWPHGAWLPFPPEADHCNGETLALDESSILHLYRRLIRLRRVTPALRRGSLTWLRAAPDVVAYERACRGDRWWILVSTGPTPRWVSMPGPAEVVLASNGHLEGTQFEGVVDGDQAMLLRADNRPERP
jgi:alpha-glucosidase